MSKKPKKLQSPEKKKASKKKKIIIISIISVVVLAAAGFAVWWFLLRPQPKEEKPEEPKKDDTVHYYSRLTGLEIASEAENNLPVYCMQIPNGADGARPQSGLTEAGVVFEAIAEAGITRFAAVFQNPSSSTIGPIRSLRSYYLDWDTPFDCAIVHAGGSTDASQAVAAGGYHDLNESYVYMWRDTASYWAPNNLMTSPALLAKFATDDNLTSSHPEVFPRLTVDEAKKAHEAALESLRKDAENTAEGSKKEDTAGLITEVRVNFGSVDTFNTVYQYDIENNVYRRSYASGEEHLVYKCPADDSQPTPKSGCGPALQVSPSAIAVMMVDERLDSDNYHHVIQTIGTGRAYIFQNGTSIEGTWKKTSKSAQIEFVDNNGNTISFTPGQLWVAAVPNYGGSVKY